METSRNGMAEIIGHEGIVSSPYQDSTGTWTVFIGHTKAAGPPDPAAMPRGVAQPLAVALDVLRRDLRAVEGRVRGAVTVPLRQHEFDALVSFDFNTGGILKARLTRLLNAGDRDGAAAAFDGWRKPPEVGPRREREKRLFRDGIFAHDGKAMVYTANADGRVDWGRGERIDIGAVLALARGEEPETAVAPSRPGAGAPPPAERPTPPGPSVQPAAGESARRPGVGAPAELPAAASPAPDPAVRRSPPGQRRPEDPGPEGSPAPRRTVLPLLAVIAILAGLALAVARSWTRIRNAAARLAARFVR